MTVEDLVYDLADLKPKKTACILNVALNKPNLVNLLISPKGDGIVINVSVNLPDGGQTAEINKFTESIKTLTVKYKAKYPKHDFIIQVMYELFIRLLCQAKFQHYRAAYVFDRCDNDVVTVKNCSGTFATVAVIASSITTTMGVASWCGMFISTATLNVPIMVMTLAVADCIHVISTMLYGMHQGKNKK